MRRLIFAAVAAALVVAPSAGAWTWPVDGPVLQAFSFGGNPYAGGQHRGIDVGAEAGAPVRAAAGGTVSFSGSVPAGGKTVTVQTADGYSVTLVHLGSISAVHGAHVDEGDVVGTVGPSGDAEQSEPYVHLGVRVTADQQGYVDPLRFLPPRASAPPAADETPPAVAPVAAAPAPAASEAPAASADAGPPAPEAQTAAPASGGVDADPVAAAASPAQAASVPAVADPAPAEPPTVAPAPEPVGQAVPEPQAQAASPPAAGGTTPTDAAGTTSSPSADAVVPPPVTASASTAATVAEDARAVGDVGQGDPAPDTSAATVVETAPQTAAPEVGAGAAAGASEPVAATAAAPAEAAVEPTSPGPAEPSAAEAPAPAVAAVDAPSIDSGVVSPLAPPIVGPLPVASPGAVPAIIRANNSPTGHRPVVIARSEQTVPASPRSASGEAAHRLGRVGRAFAARGAGSATPFIGVAAASGAVVSHASQAGASTKGAVARNRSRPRAGGDARGSAGTHGRSVQTVAEAATPSAGGRRSFAWWFAAVAALLALAAPAAGVAAPRRRPAAGPDTPPECAGATPEREDTVAAGVHDLVAELERRAVTAARTGRSPERVRPRGERRLERSAPCRRPAAEQRRERVLV